MNEMEEITGFRMDIENSKFWSEERKSSIHSNKDSDFAYGWQRDIAKRRSEFTDFMDRNFDKLKKGHAQEEGNYWNNPFHTPWEAGEVYGYNMPDTIKKTRTLIRVNKPKTYFSEENDKNFQRVDFSKSEFEIGVAVINAMRQYFLYHVRDLRLLVDFSSRGWGQAYPQKSGYILIGGKEVQWSVVYITAATDKKENGEYNRYLSSLGTCYYEDIDGFNSYGIFIKYSEDRQPTAMRLYTRDRKTYQTLREITGANNPQ